MSLERSTVETIPLDKHEFPTNIFRKISSYLATPWFTLVLAAMIVVIYILDLNTPLGVPIWLLYFVPLFLAFWSRPYYAVPTVCAVTLLFLVAGFVYSPPGIQTPAALLMRMVFSVVFISISVALWRIRRRLIQEEILQKS